MHLDHDTQAVLLLTTYFGNSGGAASKPLGPKEWGRFATWLNSRGNRPGQLLDDRQNGLLDEWSDPKITGERLTGLLDRGSALAMALEKWERAGLWIVTRADSAYPARLKRRLRELAPPVLFGFGNKELLDRGGIAVVGSRNVTDDGRIFAAELGRKTALAGCPIVSGGARGVDETAMLGALEHEGQAVGILANDLIRQASSSKYRKYLRSNDLVLVSPFKPDGRFQVGNAMARNKYIYCAADTAVVVACEEGSGGTWSGGTEALRNEWVPVWVLDDPDQGAGNLALLNKGAYRLNPTDFQIETLDSRCPPSARNAESKTTEGETGQSLTEARPENLLNKSQASGKSIFNAFLAEIEPLLRAESARPELVAERLGLNPTQTKTWLKEAEKLDRVVVEEKRPLKYRWNDHQESQGSLFEKIQDSH